MVRKLLPLIPEHKTYVEVFGGAASLLFAKEPSPVEVYNDADGALVNFFRVLRDDEKFERFYKLASLTPYSREEYQLCQETWEDCSDDVERAYRFFVAVRMSINGRLGSGWSHSISTSTRKMAQVCSGFLSTISGLPDVHARLMRVQIEHSDWRVIFNLYDTPDTFFYLDPPYVPDTRKALEIYRHEMTYDDHVALVEILPALKGRIMLSCYWHPIYQPLLDAGWQKHDFKTACYATGRTRFTGILGNGAALEKQPRTETVLLSPKEST